MKSYAIGVDLGGTSIKAGVVDHAGNVIDAVSVDSRASHGPPAVIRQIVHAIRELLTRQNPEACLGIGIGSPGVVTEAEGLVKHPPNFVDWAEVPLGKEIGKVFPFPVSVENDANVAAIAEARYGAGAEYKDFLFVIWGTGVGGGIIMDRKIFRGPTGGAGEIGHVSIDYNGPHCNCGNRGCIESYIGQRYLSERTKEILQHLPKEAPASRILELVGGDMAKIEPAVISQAAEMGDATAREILEEAGKLLGYALASILNVLDLRIVIIGGGISAAPQYVYEAIERALCSRILKGSRAGVRVVRARLGNSAGIIGAASLVLP